MLKRLKRVFDLPDRSAPDRPAALAVAAAALLIEAALLDGHFGADERRAIGDALERHFGLGATERDALIAEGAAAQAAATDLYGYTRTINAALAPSDRIQLLEMTWEVVYADGALHDLEASLMRRLGALLQIDDRERGEARRRVLSRLSAVAATKE